MSKKRRSHMSTTVPRRPAYRPSMLGAAQNSGLAMTRTLSCNPIARGRRGRLAARGFALRATVPPACGTVFLPFSGRFPFLACQEGYYTRPPYIYPT